VGRHTISQPVFPKKQVLDAMQKSLSLSRRIAIYLHAIRTSVAFGFRCFYWIAPYDGIHLVFGTISRLCSWRLEGTTIQLCLKMTMCWALSPGIK